MKMKALNMMILLLGACVLSVLNLSCKSAPTRISEICRMETLGGNLRSRQLTESDAPLVRELLENGSCTSYGTVELIPWLANCHGLGKSTSLEIALFRKLFRSSLPYEKGLAIEAMAPYGDEAITRAIPELIADTKFAPYVLTYIRLQHLRQYDDLIVRSFRESTSSSVRLQSFELIVKFKLLDREIALREGLKSRESAIRALSISFCNEYKTEDLLPELRRIAKSDESKQLRKLAQQVLEFW